MHAQTSHLPLIQVSEPVVWQGVRLTGVQLSSVLFSSESALFKAPTAGLLAIADAASYKDRVTVSGHTQRFFLNFLRQQDFTFATLGQNKNSVTALILYLFSSMQVAPASKVKFLRCVVLKGPASWIVLCRVVLCCDLPQTFWYLRWTKPCFLPPLTPAPNYRKPPSLLADPACRRSAVLITVLT